MGFFAATFEIARQTLRQLLQNRLLWVVLIAMVAVAGLGAAIVHAPKELRGRNLYANLSWWMIGNVLLPWSTLYFGVQAIHGDIEDRTFQYLFLRPVPRAAVLLGKWIAVAVLCAGMFALGTLLVFAGCASNPARWDLGIEPQMAIVFVEAMVLAALAYSALAAFFAAKFQRPLVWGAFFIVGLQMFVANMPAKAGIRVLTITDPVRRFLMDGIEPDQRLARLMWPAEREWNPDLIGQPLLNLSILTAVTLLLALWYYVRSEYDSRPRD